AEQGIESWDAARERLADETGAVLIGDQTWKDVEAAAADGEIVEAAAVGLAAIFDHPQPAAVGAIGWRELLEAQNAMGNRVHGLVQRLGGEVVEHQHGRAVAGEIVLQHQDLAAIAKRALR